MLICLYILQKELGLCNLVQYLEGAESFVMAPFTRILGWAREEVEVFLVSLRKEVRDNKIHPIINLYVFRVN